MEEKVKFRCRFDFLSLLTSELTFNPCRIIRRHLPEQRFMDTIES
jgi:hypothetical protein